MKITPSEVEHVGRLARIKIGDDEKKRFLKELNAILDYMDMLSSVDTNNIAPTTHTQHIINALREDKVSPSQDVRDALFNALEVKESAFSVPGVIE